MPSVKILRQLAHPRLSLRSIHSSNQALARKKKVKTTLEDEFSEDVEEEDLFASVSQVNSPKQTLATATTSSSDKRVSFETTLARLQATTGKEAKETKSKYLAGEGALRQLITRSQSIEDISSIFEVLKSWRTYPGRPFSNLVEAWLFDRSIALSCETQLLDVLAHRPLYGISVPSLRHARAIMKGILEPSKVINAEEESTKLQAALSLSQILDASLVQDPSATSSPSLITPSVASDLVMSSLLLATMLRTIPLPTSPTISKDDDSFINSSAFIHFLTTTSSSVTTLRPPTSAREYIWTNRALQSTKRLLEDTENGLLESLKQASILLNGEEEGEKVIDDPLAALQVVADHLGAGENLGENVRKKAGLL